jgi:hypothetical protein
MSTQHHGAVPGQVSTIDLPQPLRAALPYSLLALLSLGLCLTPVWPVGLVAAAAFAVAAALTAWREQRALDRLRASVDATLIRRRRQQLSPLLLWRTGEVTGQAFRDHVASELRRVVDVSRAGSLPGASPVDRAAVRRNADSLVGLAARLEGPDPLDAQAILLARSLAHDATSPFYDAAANGAADRAVAEVVRAFDRAHSVPPQAP